MIKSDLLKTSFVWNFHNKIVCLFNLIFFGTTKQDYVIKRKRKREKAREMFNFLPLIIIHFLLGEAFYY